MTALGYITRISGAKDEHNPGAWGDSELIARDPKTGELTAGQDKRHTFGKAAGD
jgi:gamma-glutamyltranspeptidase/glutathione hydrolase